MTTIRLRKLGVVFPVCWDEELVAGKHDGEVLMISWRHAQVGGYLAKCKSVIVCY